MEQIPSTLEQPVANVDDTVVFKRSHFYSILVVLSFAVGVLVGYMAWGRGAPAQQVAAAPAQQVPAPGAAQAPAAAPQENPENIRYEIPTEGYPSHGPEDAEIVLVEFSDYQ